MPIAQFYGIRLRKNIKGVKQNLFKLLSIGFIEYSYGIVR